LKIAPLLPMTVKKESSSIPSMPYYL
jgi:hypothetical protein